MRLMTAADRPEPLWPALRMVQVVLRASPSASDCWSRVTNPASMRDCPSSRIFAACRDFISVTTDVPFRWDERWALAIATLRVTGKLVGAVPRPLHGGWQAVIRLAQAIADSMGGKNSVSQQPMPGR